MLIGTRTVIAAGIIWSGLSTGVTAQEAENGPGKEIFVQHCTRCHELTNATVRHSPEGEWREIVDRMITYGAVMTVAEKAKLVSYLAKNYGPKGAASASSAKPAH